MNSSIDNRKPFNSLGKQKYHRPELVLYGKVSNLTGGSLSTMKDADDTRTLEAMPGKPISSVDESGGSGASSDSVFDNFDW